MKEKNSKQNLNISIETLEVWKVLRREKAFVVFFSSSYIFFIFLENKINFGGEEK